jgi:peptidoglycan-associated lipoprotein
VSRSRKLFVFAFLFLSVVMISGCKKTVAPLTAATAPTAVVPAPTAQISASPSVITAGDSVVLSWNSTNATSASIDSIGSVAVSGKKTVTLSYSTSYTLDVKGAGGAGTATVRVTVNPAKAEAPAYSESQEEAFKSNVKDVFFDYDKYAIRADEQAAIARDAAYLSKNPSLKFTIGGYCDERGSEEYNLALGENRAESAKKALISAGVDPSRIEVISYGKEKQFCTQETEQCWQENRRGGFALNH